MVIHFLFHRDFDATSDTESKIGFWGKGLCLLNFLSHPFQQCPRNARSGKAKLPFLDSPSYVQSASTVGGA